MADIANLTVRVTAAVGEFNTQLAGATAAVDKFGKEAEATSRAFARMTASFSGEKIISQANSMIAAIEKIGGATKLTEAEQARVNRTLEEALAKYAALGQQAPEAMQKLARETKAAETATAKVGAASDEAGKKFLSLSNAAGALKGALVGMLAGFSVGALVSTLTQATKAVFDFAGSISDLSSKTGVSTDQLQRWNAAATQNGNTLEQITGAVTQMSKRLAEGDDSAAGALEQIGLSFETLRQQDPAKAFNTMATAVAGIQDPMKQTAVAMALFGKAGADILPTLKADMVAIGDEAARLGAIIDSETVAAMDNLGDATGNLSLAAQGLLARGLVPALPTLERMAALLLTAARNMDVLIEAWELGGGIIGGGLAGIKIGIQAAEDALMKLPPIAGAGREEINKFGAAVQANALKLPKFSEAAQILAEETKKTGDAWKKAEADAKAYQAALDTLSGRTAINTARELVQQIQAIGGASKVASDQAAAAAQTLMAGMRAMVESGQAVPPLWRDIAVQLQMAGSHTAALIATTMQYPPAIQAARIEMSKLRQELQIAAETPPVLEGLPKIGQGVGTSHPDWNKIIPPPDNKFWVERGKLIGDAILVGMARPLSQGESRIGAIGQSIGATLGQQVGTAAGKKVGDVAGKAIGGAMGSAIGGIAGSVLPVVGTMLGAVAGNFIGKLFGPSQQEQVRDMRTQFLEAAGGLDELKQRAAGSAEALAALARLQSAKKVKDFEKAQQDLTAAIEKQEKALQKLGEALKKTSQSGALLGKDLFQQIAKIDPKGAGGEAVFTFFQEQTERAMKGIETFVNNARITSESSAAAITASMGAIFEDLRLQGLTASEALTRMGPAILTIQQQLQAAGISGGAAFDYLAMQAQFAADTVAGPMFTAVAGIGDLLVGLGNTGRLNDEIFKGLTSQITETWHEIEKAGKGGAAGLQLLQKPLQTVYELWKDQGFAIDDATKELLDFAMRQGIVGEQFRSTQDKMVTAIEALVERIGKLIDVFATDMPAGAKTGAQQTQDYLDGIRAPTIEVPVVFKYEEFDPPTATAAAGVAGAAVIENDIHIDVDGAEIARVAARHTGRVLAPYGVG